MFSKILGKKNTADALPEIVAKISKMSLSEMSSYVKNKIPDEEVDEDGLIAVMNRLLSVDEKSSNRYIKEDDMDSKIKKAFELVMLVAKNKKVTVKAVELIQEFTLVYADIIKNYDTQNKQIYGSRLNDSIKNAVDMINSIADINNKMTVIK